GTVAKQQGGPTSPKAAIAAVAAYNNIPSSAMVGGRRDRPAAQARQIAMYLLRHTFGLTPEEIGQTLGNRDRTTVLYSIKQVARKLEQDASFAAALAQLAASLETSSNTAGPQ
ncbi:MAG: helix-turn-helix domain-containing protein, partial [Dehalococcoidia bacterium]